MSPFVRVGYLVGDGDRGSGVGAEVADSGSGVGEGVLGDSGSGVGGGVNC